MNESIHDVAERRRARKELEAARVDVSQLNQEIVKQQITIRQLCLIIADLTTEGDA